LEHILKHDEGKCGYGLRASNLRTINELDEREIRVAPEDTRHQPKTLAEMGSNYDEIPPTEFARRAIRKKYYLSPARARRGQYRYCGKIQIGCLTAAPTGLRQRSKYTMKSGLHDYILPGLVHFMAYPANDGDGVVLDSLAELLEDWYFEVVEISGFKDPATRAQAKRLLASSGIQVRYCAHPVLLTQRLNLNSLERLVRTRAVQEMRSGIDEAVELGASDFCLLSGPYEGECKKAANLDALEESLDDLCHYAKDREIGVSLEVFDRNIDKKCLIGPAADAKEIARRLKRNHRNFGLVVDLSHIPLLGETPADALRPVADDISHVHIGNCYCDRPDNPAYGDKHPRFGYPGSVNDIPQITAFLKELFHVGYLKADASVRRAISFEIKPVGDESSGVMIAGAKRKLAEAWNRLTLD